VRGHGPASDDAGSYMLFKPTAAATSNSAGSDYMAMPGVLKAASVEAGGGAGDQDKSNRLLLSSRAASFSSSPGSHVSEYMEMAAHAAHGSKVVSEPGSKKVMQVPLKKLSTGSRGGDDYMSMQARKEEAYVDVKNLPSRCGGWLYDFTSLHVIFFVAPHVHCCTANTITRECVKSRVWRVFLLINRLTVERRIYKLRAGQVFQLLLV